MPDQNNRMENRVLAVLDADTPTLATVNTNVLARLGAINGIDRGTIACSTTPGGTQTATIGAVVMARTDVTFSCRGGEGDDNANAPYGAKNVTADGVLTNTTTITATTGALGSTYAIGTAPRLSFQAIEYAA